MKLSDNFLGKFTHRLMGGFKTSDEYTRAIAYSATREMFDTAYTRLKNNLIDLEGFRKASGLNLIDNQYVQKQVLDLIQSGEVDAALTKYATQTIEETMFAYRPTEKPLFGGKSVFGKLFWQYGTYSSGYVANMIRGFKNGSLAQKAAFVGRLAASSAVIGGILNELNIDNRNFMPWTPTLFTGGPLLDLGWDVIKSFDGGYQGAQARNRLKKFLVPYKNQDGELRFGKGLPFSYQLNNIKRMLEALDNGDTHLAWLFATWTPGKPDAVENYY